MKHSINVRIVTFGIGIAILIAGIRFGHNFDTILLLDENYPSYLEYFSQSEGAVHEIPANVLNSGRVNLLVHNVNNEESPDGYAIRINDDGSIVFSGINNGNDRYITLSGYPFQLPIGKYRISDGGASSENGLYLYIEGWDTRDGLMTKQILARLPGDGRFETAPVYSNYWFGIKIPAGFSSEELVVYPMIIDVNDDAGSDNNLSYLPCFARQAVFGENSSFLSYLTFSVSKVTLSEISVKNLGLFLNNVRYSYLGRYDWVTLDFRDGTGIEFKGRGGEDPSGKFHAVYGFLDNYGRVIRPLNDLIIEKDYISLADEYNDPLGTQSSGINGINVHTNLDSLFLENDFLTYLTMLNNKELIIFLSIKDEGTRALDEMSTELLRQLGLTADYANMDHFAYYAVIENGNVVLEKSEKGMIEAAGKIPGEEISYTIASAGYNDGNVSSTIINDIEYSRNERGMNFVIYDTVQDKVIDSVAFDTFSGLVARRW